MGKHKKDRIYTERDVEINFVFYCAMNSSKIKLVCTIFKSFLKSIGIESPYHKYEEKISLPAAVRMKSDKTYIFIQDQMFRKHGLIPDLLVVRPNLKKLYIIDVKKDASSSFGKIKDQLIRYGDEIPELLGLKNWEIQLINVSDKSDETKDILDFEQTLRLIS